MSLRINEVFGPTIQGEGVSAGRHCLFVRVSRCNLHCSWCDTPYTWAHTDYKASLHNTGHKYDISAEEHEMTVSDILDRLWSLWNMDIPTMIVISGGEPMLQQNELQGLVRILKMMGHDVEVETAGTILPAAPWVHEARFNVSPKLAHSGNNLRARRNIAALSALAKLNTSFKFVATRSTEFEEIDLLVEAADIPRDKIWIMPEGLTHDAVVGHAKLLVDDVLKRGWNLTLRNHISIWGEARGK